MITARIDDVKANAYAVDLGAMYPVKDNLTLAATINNVGTKLKFLNEGDSLPMAVRVGAAYKPLSRILMTLEGVYRKTGLASAHLGTEWKPFGAMSLRAGYRTDTVKELSPIAGISAGMGLNLWGQELAYAYLPYGDLGNTHYFSLLMKFSERVKAQTVKAPTQMPGTSQTAQVEPEEAVIPAGIPYPLPSDWRTNPKYKYLWDLLTDIEKNAEMNRQSSTVGPI